MSDHTKPAPVSIDVAAGKECATKLHEATLKQTWTGVQERYFVAAVKSWSAERKFNQEELKLVYSIKSGFEQIHSAGRSTPSDRKDIADKLNKLWIYRSATISQGEVVPLLEISTNGIPGKVNDLQQLSWMLTAMHSSRLPRNYIENGTPGEQYYDHFTQEIQVLHKNQDYSTNNKEAWWLVQEVLHRSWLKQMGMLPSEPEGEKREEPTPPSVPPTRPQQAPTPPSGDEKEKEKPEDKGPGASETPPGQAEQPRHLPEPLPEDHYPPLGGPDLTGAGGKGAPDFELPNLPTRVPPPPLFIDEPDGFEVLEDFEKSVDSGLLSGLDELLRQEPEPYIRLPQRPPQAAATSRPTIRIPQSSSQQAPRVPWYRKWIRG